MPLYSSYNAVWSLGLELGLGAVGLRSLVKRLYSNTTCLYYTHYTINVTHYTTSSRIQFAYIVQFGNGKHSRHEIAVDTSWWSVCM